MKFAKFVASDQENAAALPLAIRYVTTTYQAEVEMDAQKELSVEEKSVEPLIKEDE